MMRTFLFLCCLGGACGIFLAAGLPEREASIFAWPVGLFLYFGVVRPLHTRLLWRRLSLASPARIDDLMRRDV
jgi:hypothetical protein